jgi:hypothetical protein
MADNPKMLYMIRDTNELREGLMTKCVGFDREILPILLGAMDMGRVRWVPRIGGNGPNSYAAFDYLGFRYKVVGLTAMPVIIEKIARVDVDDDGYEVVTDLTEERALEELQLKALECPGWGSF